MGEHRRTRSRRRAARVYALLLRLYPRAHRRAFGEQMLQAFQDHYQDAVEADGQTALHFWLGVLGDEGKSLLREHVAMIAALRERGAGHWRILAVLAVQVLALAGVALLAGGLLAVLAVRLIAPRLVPGLVQQGSDVIVDGAVTSVSGIMSAIAVMLLLLIAVLVLLRAMRRATVHLPQGG
jgi:hypothetical protein